MLRGDKMPGYARRRAMAATASVMLPMGILLVLNIAQLFGAGANSPRVHAFGIGSVAVATLVVGGLAWCWQVRIARRIRDVRYTACLECAYDMMTCADMDRCPECGLEWDAQEATRLWRDWCSPFLLRT